MASAEIAATAIGRKRGSSIPIAASATKNPLSAMEAKKSGPPPRPPPPPARTAIVIRTGTAASTAMPAQLRRRPKMSFSSDRRKRVLGRRDAARTIASAADIEALAGQGDEEFLQIRGRDGELPNADPVVHQRGDHLLRREMAQPTARLTPIGLHVSESQ